MYSEKDLGIIRELAKRYMEIATNDRHVKMRQRFRDTNNLKIVRPPLNIEEIPWHEMNFEHELDCFCDDGGLRNIEYSLRVALFREKHFKSDSHMNPYWAVYKSYSNTGNGFMIKENIVATDKRNHIVSHQYIDTLADENALSVYHDPVITAHPEDDIKNISYYEEIFADTLPVKLIGHGIYYAPWDVIVMLHGLENSLIDIYERPCHLHKIMELFTRGMKCEMEQMDALGLYDSGNNNLHCTPGDVTVPSPSEDGHHLKDIWFRTMAQAFSSVSPGTHYEFDVQYSIPLAERCAFTYYGCCEPLHDRIDMLKKYKNLRKIGVSPWANVAASAEIIGGDYVLSRKPNPTNVAFSTDTEVVREEIAETAKLCLKYGCPCDITLKDISTVSYKPENLFIWAKTASDVLDEFYGE